MKILYFPKKFPYFFCDLCFYATVQKFRLLDCFMLHATIVDMTLKDLVSIFLNKVHFWLVRLLREKQMLVIITKKSQHFNFLKSSTVLKLLFALFSVIKDSE